MSEKPEKEICISRYLAELVHKIGASPVSAEDSSVVRQHLLDGIAAAFLGSRTGAFRDLANTCPRVSDGCGWPGSGGGKLSPPDAAMAWSFAMHASVYEDGSREGACHPAPVVFPVIIALAQGKSWQQVDKAAVAGYDAMIRILRSGNPGFTRKGFHPTAIAAPFGAAAAAALLLELDLEQTANALSIAAMGCGGLMAAFKRGETQPLQVGMSTRNGLLAALLAAKGHPGHPPIIEDAFYPAYLAEAPRIAIDADLANGYAIRGSYLKPYPGCRHVHPSIDAFVQVLQHAHVSVAQVQAIKVRTYRVAVETEIHQVNRRGDAYFNIPYALGAMLVLNRCDYDAFDEKHFANRDIQSLMKKVEVVIDPDVDKLYPGRRGSIVEVTTTEGKVLSGKVDFALGEPENPLPLAIIKDKFQRSAGGSLSENAMSRVESMLEVNPKDTIEALLKLIC